MLKWYFPKVILISIALQLFIKLNSMADSFSVSSLLPMIKIFAGSQKFYKQSHRWNIKYSTKKY